MFYLKFFTADSKEDSTTTYADCFDVKAIVEDGDRVAWRVTCYRKQGTPQKYEEHYYVGDPFAALENETLYLTFYVMNLDGKTIDRYVGSSKLESR